MALFCAGYFRSGLFRPGFFGVLGVGPVVLPLAPDELTARRLGDIVSDALTAAGQTIRVWVDEIPQVKPGDLTDDGIDTRFPAILVKLHDSDDQVTAAGIRVVTSALYQVQVIDQGTTFATMSGVANLIDQALITASGAATRDGLYWVSRAVRKKPIRYTSRSEATGYRYNYQGGLYSVLINALFTTPIPVGG